MRYLGMLVESGVLPPPQMKGIRRFWPEAAIDLAELRRQAVRRRPPASGRLQATRRKRDGAELVLAFWQCWRACGLQVAVDLVRVEGLEHPGQVPIGVHNRLARTLRRAAGAGMTLDAR